VHHLIDLMGVSERFACRVTGQHRTTQRHHPAATTPADPDAGLRQWLRDYAAAHPRWGHRRAYHDARGEGWTVNHKKLQRLWRDEGLRVPQRHRRKRLGTSTADRVTADAPNRVWAVDFQFDSTTDGRPVKIVSIVDEHTRECLGGLVERSITADRLIDELDRLADDRGYPAVLRCDNGPELACTAMADWAGERVGLAFIPTRRTLAQRLHRILQRPAPRRMPQHRAVLVPGPCPGHHHRLEERVQPAPTTLSPRLPSTSSLR
jgi:transposase InsO family protein